ncbi:MAG: hypothetical protein LBG45_01570 [Dysgonamonadaceae bacterium]|nr:hypothetical protein [Dysgonamonadaceae bacterium]
MLHSCGNEDVINEEKVVTTTVVNPDAVKMQTVAKLLTGLTTDQRIATEVRAGIERSLTYGLDEELRFTDILQPRESKMLRSGDDNLLAESVRNLLNGYNSTSGLRSSGKELETFLLNENIQIYWPYSEDWDGKETPVITFDPGTGNADKVIAYRFVKLPDGTAAIDSFIVDEAYAMEHPVWVINKNDIDYEDLPDFSNGEYEKNGISYNIPKQGSLPSTQLRSATDANKVYELTLTKMKATQQHDDWVNGGSEFRVVCFFPTTQFGLAKTGIKHVDFTRKEIKKGKEKDINYIFNYDWSEDQLHHQFKIWESDSGSSRDVEIKITTSYTPKDENGNPTGSPISAEFKTTLSLGSNDDDIMDTVVPRSTFFATDAYVNATTNRKSFEGRGVTITCEIKTKDKIN